MRQIEQIDRQLVAKENIEDHRLLGEISEDDHSSRDSSLNQQAQVSPHEFSNQKSKQTIRSKNLEASLSSDMEVSLDSGDQEIYNRNETVNVHNPPIKVPLLLINEENSKRDIVTTKLKIREHSKHFDFELSKTF